MYDLYAYCNMVRIQDALLEISNETLDIKDSSRPCRISLLGVQDTDYGLDRNVGLIGGTICLIR